MGYDMLISLFYMSNWARAFNIHPPDYLGHTWSLSIEEQFYLFWPFILLMLLRTFKNRWFIVSIAFSMALFSWYLRVYLMENGAYLERIFNGLDTRADGLMMGCALGVIISSNLLGNEISRLLAKYLRILNPILILALIYISTNITWINKQMYYWFFFDVGFITALLILHLFLNKNTIVHKILSMRWIVWVGSISYGLYLWHYPIYRTMDSLGYGDIEMLVYGTCISFIFSTFSYYIIEKPILKLKKKYFAFNVQKK